MKERKLYQKPAVVFEKELEAIAADCDPTQDGVYTGGTPKQPFCKGEGLCSGALYS